MVQGISIQADSDYKARQGIISLSHLCLSYPRVRAVNLGTTYCKDEVVLVLSSEALDQMQVLRSRCVTCCCARYLGTIYGRLPRLYLHVATLGLLMATFHLLLICCCDRSVYLPGS